MGQSMVYNSNNYDNYTERIRYLRSTNEQLLQKIRCLEISLNKRKLQNKEPFYHDIIEQQCLITKSLQSLAEINVCQFFYLVNEYHNANDYYYKQMCRKYFQDLLQQFNKCVNQNNEKDDDIDFIIG